jgi:hypothetical protein
MTDSGRPGEAKYVGHVFQFRAERPRSLARQDDDVGKLVQRDGSNGGRFVQPDPDICQNDCHKRWQVQQDYQPWVADPVDQGGLAHRKSGCQPQQKSDRESHDHPQQGAGQVIRERQRTAVAH